MNQTINIAEDFSQHPGGRYPEDGKGNGTIFREKFLVPAIKSGEKAEIILDGARGYPSSFLEEAFGGLVREGYSAEQVESTFEFIAKESGYPRFIALIREYIRMAEKVAKAKAE